MSLHLTVTNKDGHQYMMNVLSKGDHVEIAETVTGAGLLDIEVVQDSTETEGGEIRLKQYMDGKYLDLLSRK